MNVEVVAAGDLQCHRCSGSLYLRAKVPHPRWESGAGTGVAHYMLIQLCPVCDAHEPAAQSLLAYFAIHSHVTEDTAEAFGRLVQRWIADVDCPAVDPAVLDREIEQWRSGEFDA